MMKPIHLVAAMLALLTTAFAANVTYSGSVGDWTDIVSPPADNDRLYFGNGADVTISTDLSYGGWLNVGVASTATFSITKNGAYRATQGNMTFGQNLDGVAIFNLEGTLSTPGAVYFGYNGGTATVSINGGTLSNSNTVWVGRSQDNASAVGYVTMTDGSIVTKAFNVAFYNNAKASTMSGYVSLLGGAFSSNDVTIGYNTSLSNQASITISSAMTDVSIANSMVLNGTANLTLLADANTVWSDKGAFIDVEGTLSIRENVSIALDLSQFAGWEGMQAGESITLTLASYGLLDNPGNVQIEAVGLGDGFSLGEIVWGADKATVDITCAAIPEPAVCAGILGLLALAAVARRRS